MALDLKGVGGTNDIKAQAQMVKKSERVLRPWELHTSSEKILGDDDLVDQIATAVKRKKRVCLGNDFQERQRRKSEKKSSTKSAAPEEQSVEDILKIAKLKMDRITF